MAERRHHGLNVDPNPLAEERTKNGAPKQSQEWPGSDARLNPPADHGQETY